LYFDNFTPGNGFVATVGVSQATLDAEASDAAAANGEGEAAPQPQQVGEQEKQDIMNLFRGH
jgi:penicillin-binding protein 1A